jgi:hypothetical protein
MRGRPKRVRAGEVAYLVVRLDIEIDLLACECADSGERGMLARCFAVLGSCDDALGTGLCQSQITYLINILKVWVLL